MGTGMGAGKACLIDSDARARASSGVLLAAGARRAELRREARGYVLLSFHARTWLAGLTSCAVDASYRVDIVSRALAQLRL